MILAITLFALLLFLASTIVIHCYMDGQSTKNTQKLQKIQNRAARLVFKANRREHTTPFLKELHWLRYVNELTTSYLRLHTKVNMQQLHLIYKTS